MKHEVLLEAKKVFTVEELKNDHHIGFTFDGETHKGYVIWSEGAFKLITIMESDSTCNCTLSGKNNISIKDIIKDHLCRIKKIYKFDTRKELYQWLSE